MSKGTGWVPIDKELVGTLKNINRPFSYIEAMFSFTLDQENKREWTYRGYAKLWQWSVGKVKRFAEGMRNTSGTVVGRKGNGRGTLVHFIDKGLWGLEKQSRNTSGTVDEHKEVGTSNPNPNPNPKSTTKEKSLMSDFKKQKPDDHIVSSDLSKWGTVEDEGIAKFIFSRIKEKFPKTKNPNMCNWANSIRLLRTTDNNTHNEIKEVFLWAHNDSFWASNILSAISLRKKFATLHAQMTTSATKNKKTGGKADDFDSRDYQAGATKTEDLPPCLRSGFSEGQ